MLDFSSLEPAADPNNKISFLLDWELTMKCNLDCSYCPTGIYGGHDNSTRHPDIKDCFRTIDFMFEYADIYQSSKIRSLRSVILNVYGGESLHYPDIDRVLERCRAKHRDSYQDRWHLTITTTTNAIISQSRMSKIIPLIDEFTCSYHSENTDRQKELFKKNLLMIKEQGRRLKVVILMHSDPMLFADSQAMIQWCDEHDIRYLPRQLDQSVKSKRFNYDIKQVQWFDSLYESRNHNVHKENPDFKDVGDETNLSALGRACCGGRQLCKDSNFRQREFFVKNSFPDWYCSVNEFFLYIKQVNGEIYTNKDCKMSFDRKVSPIGHLDESDVLLAWTRKNIKNKTMPVIQCKKSVCWCGLCAPKAQELDVFKNIMEKYHV